MSYNPKNIISVQIKKTGSGSINFIPENKNSVRIKKIDCGDVGFNKPIQQNPCNPQPLYGAAFSPDGSLLVIVGYSFVCAFETIKWTRITLPIIASGYGQSVAFNKAGTLLAITHVAYPYISIYNTFDWSKLPDLIEPPSSGVWASIAFSFDDNLMAIGCERTPYIFIYNTSDWSKVADPAIIPTRRGHGVAFSHNNQWLAISGAFDSSGTKSCIIYNTSDWSVATYLPTHAINNSLDFNLDDSLLVIGNWEPIMFYVFETSGWSKLAATSFIPPGEHTWSVKFSPDGELLVIGHDISPYITVYKVSDWSNYSSPSVIPSCNIKDLAFSPNGDFLACVGSRNYPYSLIYKKEDII